MLEVLDISVLLLILSLLTNAKSTKSLSDQKKCGDPECETSMSRVQTIKDHIGPDCRYLNFKTGEEIIVYFKLSRKREDLWAGSKGQEFGFFPMDTVQIEEVFITKEVEVPTKETDFLCLDGGEYVFENEDSILNHDSEENEYIPFYTDEQDSELKMPENEALKLKTVSFRKRLRTDSNSDEFDSTSKDLYTLETTSHGDSELGHSKTGQVETNQHKDQRSQTLTPIPTQSAWTVSGIAGWLGLGSKQNEEPMREIPESTEQITFRRRKIAIADDSDLKNLNDEGEIEPRDSNWFQSSLTDLLHFRNEKSELGLLYKTNDPEIHDHSIITENADHHGSTTASDAIQEEHSDSEGSRSSWFDLELSDILTFGYSKENKVRREKYAGEEMADLNKEPVFPSSQSAEIVMDEGLRKRTAESMFLEEQHNERRARETPQQPAVESVLHEGQNKEHYVPEALEGEKAGSEVQIGSEHIAFKDAAVVSSFPTEPTDNVLKSHYAEQDSISNNQVMENINIKVIMEESERKNDQSGWYESIYSSIISFHRVGFDNQPHHESIAVQSSQESVLDQLPHRVGSIFDPINTQAAKEENHESPQKHNVFFSLSHITDLLNGQGVTSKRTDNTQNTQEDLVSSEENPQSKKSGEILQVGKQIMAQLPTNQKVTEKMLENKNVGCSQENIMLSFLAAKNNEECIEKTPDDKLVKSDIPHFQPVKSKLEHRISYGQHIQITKNGKPQDHSSEGLEMEDHSNIGNRNDVPILKVTQPSSEFANVVDSPEPQENASDSIYSCEKLSHVKEEPNDDKTVRPEQIEGIENSLLEATKTYVEKISKEEIMEMMEDEEESNVVTHEKLTFKKLKGHLDHFPQMKDISGKDEGLVDVSNEGRLAVQGSRKQTLSDKFQIIESTEVNGVISQADGYKNYSSEDIVKNVSVHQKEEGTVVCQITQNTAQFLSASSPFQNINLEDPDSEKEKSSKSEKPQTLFSFSPYKHFLCFQSDTAKTNNNLQKIQEYMSSKDENSQSKKLAELLLRSKEEEESHQEKGKEPTQKNISNTGTVLPSSTTQNNKDSDHVLEDAQLLKAMSLESSAEYQLERRTDSIDSNQKLKGKNTEDGREEFPPTKDNIFLLGKQPNGASELKCSVQKSSQQYKTMHKSSKSNKQHMNEKGGQKMLVPEVLNGGSRQPVIEETDIMKRVLVSDPLSSLQLHSEKQININIEDVDVVDPYKEKELVDVKNKENILADPIKDYFPMNSNDGDKQNANVTMNEVMNQFFQEKTKEQRHFSHVSGVSEDNQGHGKEIPNVLNKQEAFLVTASEEVFQSEKEIPRCSEDKCSSKSIQHVDIARVYDASLKANILDSHVPQDQIVLSHPISSILPKEDKHSPKVSVSFPYEKEDHKELETEQVSSSHLELSNCGNSGIRSVQPGKMCICQIGHDIHSSLTPDLEAQRPGLLFHQKQADGTKPEYQQKIVSVKSNVKPELHAVTSQKSGEKESLLTITDYNMKQHNLVENIAKKHPVQHLESWEVQSETLNAAHNSNPDRHLSRDVPPHIEAVDHNMNHVLLQTKNSLGSSHLAIDLADETLARTRLLPKNLNHVDQLADFKNAKEMNGKGKNGIENEKEIKPKKIESNDKTREESSASDYGKMFWFLGRPFQSKHNEDSQVNEDSEDIVTQRQETEVVGSNFEMIEQESQEKIYSHSPEKSIAEVQGNSPKDNIFIIQERESAFQKTVKKIADPELDSQEAASLGGFKEFYLKLVQESNAVLQANMYESHKLLLLEFEKLNSDITTFPCEDVLWEKKQVPTSVDPGNRLNMEREKCMKEKMNILSELQGLVLDIRKKCEVQRAEAGMTNKGKLRADTPREKHPLNSDNEPTSDQHSKANKINPVHIDEKIQTSVKNGQLDLEKNLRESNLMIQNYTLNPNLEWPFQIILHFSDFCEFISSAFSMMTSISKKAIAVFSEDMKPGTDLYGFPWEMVICAAAVAIFTVLLLMCRMYQSVRSRHYVGRERKLASAIAELVEDKCQLLEKLSLRKKEYEELEKSLKDASLLKGSTDTANIKTAYEELSSSNSSLKNGIECLEKDLEEEKAKGLKLDDQMAEIQRKKEYLENEAKSIQLQVAEAKTTLKVYEINRERLKTSLQDAIEENGHLHESEKQLLQEVEGWRERCSELNEQKKMFESSKAYMEEALKNKESQVKSLTEYLLKMKDWSCVTGEHDAADDNHWDNDVKTETENGENLEDQDKLTVRKLIYAVKLNAHLKSVEAERNQIYCKLTDENKAKEELAERIENLKREHVMMKSENTQLENEIQKLQQKVKVMTELYQENEMNLHRKLTVEERERLQKEEKLSKSDEKVNHAAEELNAYRQRAKDLEEELERTVRSYQSQIMSHEKKAHDNWLTARAAERHLNDIRKENSHNRQKLTEAEFKLDLLEKDPYALDVPLRAFGREHSPYGPSPMSRPSSETRAFLSPPTLLEGPLRLSPVLPGGGGRGSRGPGNTGIYEAGNGRGELNCDRSSDPHRPPSDTGSLSPPWDRDHRIIPPPAGQLYNEQSLPPRRSERFYFSPPNSGRLSGPAELRSYNVHSFDKADGQSCESNLRMDLSGNGTKDHPSENNTLSVSDQSLAPASETFGAGIVPPPLPLLRAPLMPMDPRGPSMRRGPPFPPMPPSALYGPHEYFPRDFSSLPRPPLPMRGPFPVRPFSQYPPPRAGFFLPPPPPLLDNRNELPADPTQLSTVSSTDHKESQQKT